MIFIYICKIFNKYLELKTVEVLSGDSLVISALMVMFPYSAPLLAASVQSDHQETVPFWCSFIRGFTKK